MDAYQEKLRMQTSTETLRASAYNRQARSRRSASDECLSKALEEILGAETTNRHNHSDISRIDSIEIEPMNRTDETTRNIEKGESREMSAHVMDCEISPSRPRMQSHERRLSAATDASKRRSLSRSSSQEEKSCNSSKSSRTPFRAIQTTAVFATTSAVAAAAVSNINTNAPTNSLTRSGKSIVSLAMEIEKAEERSKIPTDTLTASLDWWSTLFSPIQPHYQALEIKDDNGEKENNNKSASNHSASSRIAPEFEDQPELDDSESTTPPSSPPSPTEQFTLSTSTANYTLAALKESAPSLKSILRRDPLYEPRIAPPPGLSARFATLSELESLQDELSNQKVDVSVRFADNSDEEAVSLRLSTPEDEPPATPPSSLTCFSKQRQQWKEPKPLRNIWIAPHEEHATLWDIDNSQSIGWMCHVFLTDPDQQACNLRSALTFHICANDRREKPGSAKFSISFSEDWSTVKATRDVHNKYGVHRDNVPAVARIAAMVPGRVTAGAWNYRDGVWMRQFCVPLPSSLFASCESRAFSVTGSVRYALDICAVVQPEMNLGGITITASARTVHVSVLHTARELGPGAILQLSKPDLTGKRLHTCAWPKSAI